MVIAGDLLGERARLTPEKLALVTVPPTPGAERLTYAELDRRATAMARVFRERLSLRKGDRVGLLSGNRVEFLDAFFACAKAGTVLVPIGTRLTAVEIAHVVQDSGLDVLLYDGDHAEHVRELVSLAPVKTALALDAAANANPGDLDLPTEIAATAEKPFHPERMDPEDLWALLYTSGTTGKPKGVMIPHRQVLWNGYNTAVSWQLREDDVTPIFLPLYHAGGLFAFLVPIVTIGGTIVLHAGFDDQEIWKTIERERATVVLGVPTIWERLSEHPGFAAADLSSVRWLVSGGAPLPRFLIDRYQERGIVFKQGYGLTEVGVNCFAMTVEESIAKAGSIGKPLMFSEARLIDAEGGAVTDGEVGELCLRGPHVSRGYWGRPEATAEALDVEGGGWWRTGDLARRDADGFYTIAGRAKDLLIRGGVNVYPAEIEGELLLHPDVRDAAVIGVPDEKWGEAGVAFVVAGERRPSPEELLEFLGSRLARYKHPSAFVFVDALPRTAYGKVVKGDLRERYLNHPTEGEAS
ncbi:MAG TPA: long-chain fatty acid--CoA ligase [Thermoanaerobaculia bacterium]|nr:long-chain fatty acid--CoA ligase [Thermoanaerobaculia bacterium]